MGNFANVVLAFIGFEVADICFDCLLMPGRALLDDIAVSVRRSDEANALFTGFQLAGRLVALVVGFSVVTTSGFWGLNGGMNAHFDAVLSLNVACLILSTSLVFVFVTDKGYKSDVGTVQIMIDDKDCIADERQLLMRPTPLDQTLSISSDDTGTQADSSDSSDTTTQHASTLLCSLMAVGWVGITSQSFFWTSWRGEEVGCIDLALQGVVGYQTQARRYLTIFQER